MPNAKRAPQVTRIDIPEGWYAWRIIHDGVEQKRKFILTQEAYKRIEVVDLIGLRTDASGLHPQFVFESEDKAHHFREKYLCRSE